MNYTTIRKTVLLVAGVAAFGSAMADGERETLGLWTFDGTSGQTVVDSHTETHTFPNLVTREDDLRLDLEWPSSASANTPLPTYTNDLQYAYLFDGLAQTNLVKTCATSIQIKHENWTSTQTDVSYNKPHAYLTVRNAGALIKDRDWTLEVIAYLPDRSGGWAEMLYIGTQTGDVTDRLKYRTNGVGLANLYGCSSKTSTAQYPNYSYPKFDSNFPAGQARYTAVYPDDARWHHIAWKWTESTRSLKCYVDYGELPNAMDWWYQNSVNLELDDGAYFTIFGFTGNAHNHMPTVQAVRLTRGDLAVADFLCTSKFDSLPETVGHWRYEGTPGEANCFVVTELSQPNRSDLRLWKHDTRYPLVYAEPIQSYLKGTSKTLVTNSSSVAASDTALVPGRCYMSCMQTNPYWTLPAGDGSFTYETFVWLDDSDIGAAYSVSNGLIFAERGGSQGATDWTKLAWGLCQSTIGSGDKALMEFDCYDALDAGGAGTKTIGKFTLTTKEWHHLAVTYDAPTRTLKVYADYKLATNIYQTTDDFVMTFADGHHLARGVEMLAPGECNTVTMWQGSIKGKVDEFRVTRRALDPSEFLRGSQGFGFSLFVR